MAKRSDFAQKLLDDLRLRKERLASSSQSSNRSNSSTAIIDAYSYARQNYRGSKDIRTNDLVGSKTGIARNKSNGSGRPSFGAESSQQQIVPYNSERSQSALPQMGDLSTALAFMLENGGKISRTDSSPRSSMLEFLQQIGMKSIDPSKIQMTSNNATRQRPSTSRLSAFSPVQIEEISKGVQRLNQILRACSSSSVNFDKTSIQIGKELLKGAMDLEKSLKMLVDLQESSEHVVKPERKNRIKLLEEGEEEEDENSATNVAKEWQLDRPRFSFDKIENGRTSLNQRLEQTERLRSVSHSRSASNRLVEQKSHPSCSDSSKKQEKARIPNVIAKLMGLEKLPEGDNSTDFVQRRMRSEPKDGGSFRRATQEIDKSFSKRYANEAVEDVVPGVKERLAVESNPFVVNTSFSVVKERNLPSSVRFEAVIDVGKPKKVVMNKEKSRETAKKNVEASYLLPQKRLSEKQSLSSQIKRSQSNHEEIQKPLVIKKSALDERDQSQKQNLQAMKHKVTAMTSKSSLKSSTEKLNKKSERKSVNSVQQSEMYQSGKHQDELVRERSLTELNSLRDTNSRNLDQNFAPRQQESESRKPRTRIMQVVDEKAVNLQKEKVMKAQNNRSDTLNDMTRSTRRQSAVLREVKPTRLKKLIVLEDEAKPSLIMPNITQVQDQLFEKAEETCDPCALEEDNVISLKEPESLTPSDDFCQNERLDDQLNQIRPCEDRELKYSIDIASEVDETIDRPESNNEESKLEAEPILTESENRLKQILVKSQLFLNTAEALFKLDIPITTTLHSSSVQVQHQDHNDEQRKVVLDCGYELMRRKGRRQELTVHPKYAKVSISFAEIRTFESLVRELSKDFEKLRMYGRDGKEGCEAEEYLVKMEENDVFGKEPDLNCMWDLGWNERVFAFVEVDEVVREVEKFVLNGLLDEFITDVFFRYL